MLSTEFASDSCKELPDLKPADIRWSYQVLYREDAIGTLYIHKDGYYRFVPTEGIQQHRFDIVDIRWLNDTGWTEPMPFFQNRISDAKKFDPDPAEISRHTDHYKLLRLTAKQVSDQEAAAYIRSMVHYYYYVYDVNCAGTTLRCLAPLFDYDINRQAMDASLGMHGAGGYRAQCGLVEGGLMFLGMYLRSINVSRSDIVAACYAYGAAFEEKFGSLHCRELRPQGFEENQPPHMCEQLTAAAIEFTYQYVKGAEAS